MCLSLQTWLQGDAKVNNVGNQDSFSSTYCSFLASGTPFHDASGCIESLNSELTTMDLSLRSLELEIPARPLTPLFAFCCPALRSSSRSAITCANSGDITLGATALSPIIAPGVTAPAPAPPAVQPRSYTYTGQPALSHGFDVDYCMVRHSPAPDARSVFGDCGDRYAMW